MSVSLADDNDGVDDGDGARNNGRRQSWPWVPLSNWSPSDSPEVMSDVQSDSDRLRVDPVGVISGLPGAGECVDAS